MHVYTGTDQGRSVVAGGADSGHGGRRTDFWGTGRKRGRGRGSEDHEVSVVYCILCDIVYYMFRLVLRVVYESMQCCINCIHSILYCLVGHTIYDIFFVYYTGGHNSDPYTTGRCPTCGATAERPTSLSAYLTY